jgi:sigma-B regulation protein RsbU (phosphoserine phosphatase)
MTEVKLRSTSRQLLERTRTMERDLVAARNVQRFLLPPRVQEGRGFALWHHYQPFDAIGGDFLDARIRPDGSMATLLADVSGHGPSAALTSAMVKTTFQRAALSATHPGDVLTAVGRDLGLSMETGQFITASAAVYDPHARQAALASAGHPFPILLRGGSASVIDTVNDLPLLIEPTQVYDRHTVLPMQSGDRLIFYTDGATEAANPAGAMLEITGLLPLLEKNAKLFGGQFLDAVFQAVRRFAAGQLRDDVALVCLEVQ